MPGFHGPLCTFDHIRNVLWCQEVILVADQWNAINGDDAEARNVLWSCFGGSIRVEIHGLAMDSKTWRELLPKQTTNIRKRYDGGLNDKEFGVWLRHHPPIFTQHSEELALLTGKVPLLLAVFARVFQEGSSWQQIGQDAQQDDIVVDLMRMLFKFYEKMDEKMAWNVYTLSIEDPWLSKSVDHRFFYVDRSSGCLCATGEMVLRLLYRVWTKKYKKAATEGGEALLARWPELLGCPNAFHPSVFGFHVQEIIKAQKGKNGLVGKYPLLDGQLLTRERFVPRTEKATLNLLIQQRSFEISQSAWVLLDPQISNYAVGVVDMVLVTDTTLVGIQVTIAKTHLSSLASFFNVWEPLARSKNLAIQGVVVAPDTFVQEEEEEEEKVDIVLLRDVHFELWQHIEHHVNHGN